MNIRENLEVIIEKHPYAESLNKKLLKESQIPGNNTNTYYTNIIGNKLSVSKDVDAPSRLIEEWVGNVIRIKYHHPNIVKILYEADMWFAQYNHGDYANSHNHKIFSTFSFVYYINAPRGSSPLVFTTSGKKIKAEAGKVVIFPGSIDHHVPKNRCENRLVLAGNMTSVRLP